MSPPVFSRLLSDVSVMSGESVTFEVDVSGSPKPSVSQRPSNLFVLPPEAVSLDDEEYQLRLYEEDEKNIQGSDDDKDTTSLSGLYISNISMQEDYEFNGPGSPASVLDVSLSISKDDTYEKDHRFRLGLTENQYYTDSIDRYFYKKQYSSLKNCSSENEELSSGNFSYNGINKNSLKFIDVLKKEEYARSIDVDMKKNNLKYCPVLDRNEYHRQSQSVLYNFDQANDKRIPTSDQNTKVTEGNFVNTGLDDYVEPVKLINLLDILQKKMNYTSSGNNFQEDESGYVSGTVSVCASDSHRYSSDASSSRNSIEFLDEDLDSNCNNNSLSDAVTRKLDAYRDEYLNVAQNVTFIPSITDIDSNYKSKVGHNLYPNPPISTFDGNIRSMSVLSAISEESFVSESDIEASYSCRDNIDGCSSTLVPSAHLTGPDDSRYCLESLDEQELKNIDILQIESRDERKRVRLAKLKYYTQVLLRRSSSKPLQLACLNVENRNSQYCSITGQNSKLFSPKRAKKINLYSFTLDIASDDHCSASHTNNTLPPGKDHVEKSSSPTPSSINATISDGAFIFCIKTFESMSITQLTSMVRDKLSRLLDLPLKTLQRLSVRFVHADAVEGPGLMSSLRETCVDTARHLVFEASMTSETPVGCWSDDVVPLILQTGYYMIYVLLHNWD